MDADLRALRALRLHWAPVSDDIWQSELFHVDGLHARAERAMLDGLTDAEASPGPSPVGVALVGQRGAGKTHLLGWARRQVQAQEGYFFLVELLDPTRFWHSAVVSMLEGLSIRPERQESQLRLMLQRLMLKTDAPTKLFGPISGRRRLTRQALDQFVEVLRKFDDALIKNCQDTIRALVLYGSVDPASQDIAQTYLTSNDEREAGERSPWGIRSGTRAPQYLVRDLSRLLAVTGPSVIAVDQLDSLLAQAAALDRADDVPDGWQYLVQLDHIAGGLMELRQHTRRTLTIVACLPTSWEHIRTKAVDTVQDRFREAYPLTTIPDESVGRALIETRFADRFTPLGFKPDYPTWPIRPEAFGQVNTYTPRELFKRCDAHIRQCLDRGAVTELTSFEKVAELGGPVVDPPVDALVRLDRRFAELRSQASVAGAFDPVVEDDLVPKLLAAGLRAWIVEQGDASDQYAVDTPTTGRIMLHARLRRTVDEDSGQEAHWAFRAIAAAHPNSVFPRIENARLKAGHQAGVVNRRLFLLRQTDDWPATPANKKALEEFEAAGGVRLSLSEEDLRTFAALQTLFTKNPDNLQAWLVARQRASDTELLRVALADAAGGSGEATDPPSGGPSPRRGPTSVSQPGEHPDVVSLGVEIDGGAPIRFDVESLRKHVAIFAGSGSGKTVLIRRLVEECALLGVSAIVLDPNNDLARLGEGWPEPPATWQPGDSEKAARYLAETDVVVWTPRREAGRPLSFQPLPDFGSVLADVDEFALAIDTAVAALVPRAKVDGGTTKAEHGRAVLTEALRSFARHGMSGLDQFIGYLADLPDGVSRMAQAGKLGVEMAQTLTASMVNDPLFGGGGTPVDPGLLLTPPAGKRARVSVISFVGLASDSQRQSFVNQLQMALFAWIKRHPAGDRPLGGLLVMDEAQTMAPSGTMTACTASTLALASQARKYGLGLVFATQAPKGLHNRIPGNAATQFFGLLNSPTQIAAAREMAQAKGGEVLDISRLRAGQFYTALEGSQFVKAQTPLCLTHHPKSPLTVEEVVQRARVGLSLVDPVIAHSG